MKEIKITQENLEKISTAITEAEGKAKVRTIEAGNVLDAVKDIEEYLGIPKKLMTGIMIDVDINAQTFPHSYKYTPESTHFTVLRKDSGWYLLSVERDTCRVPSKKFLRLRVLTDAQKHAILDRFNAWG